MCAGRLPFFVFCAEVTLLIWILAQQLVYRDSYEFHCIEKNRDICNGMCISMSTLMPMGIPAPPRTYWPYDFVGQGGWSTLSSVARTYAACTDGWGSLTKRSSLSLVGYNNYHVIITDMGIIIDMV